MSIKDFVQKIKGWGSFRLPTLRTIPNDLFLGALIILISLGSFGLGRLSKIEGSKTAIHIENAPEIVPGTFDTAIKAGDIPIDTPPQGTRKTEAKELVGSKTGNKYHYPWCPGASKIAEENRIYFISKSDAEARGYTPASNCKGL